MYLPDKWGHYIHTHPDRLPSLQGFYKPRARGGGKQRDAADGIGLSQFDGDSDLPEAYDGSDGGSTHPSDDDSEASGDEGDDEWNEALCARLRVDYLRYLACQRNIALEDGSPWLRLRCCPHCFSEEVKPIEMKPVEGADALQAARTVLFVNSMAPFEARVPLYTCGAPKGVRKPECAGTQHVSLLRLGYFPSTLGQALNLGSQRYGRPLMYLHVDFLRSFCSLQNHAPAMSAKAFCASFAEIAGYGFVSDKRLEAILGKMVERWRHLDHVTMSMASCDIADYPPDAPLVGACPCCAEAVDPVTNEWPGATIDLQLDACMSFVHFDKSAAAANAKRMRPYIHGAVLPVSAEDGKGMFPSLSPHVPRGSKEGCEWIYGIIKDGKGEAPATTCSRFAAAKVDIPEKAPEGKARSKPLQLDFAAFSVGPNPTSDLSYVQSPDCCSDQRAD